jgi:5-(carboxyamino)imidazole ribonucleotide synthase
VDVATFESEFFDGEKLCSISQKLQLPLHPNPLLMHELQDRLSQKKILEKHRLPTTPFIPLEGGDQAQAEQAFSESESPSLILKLRRFGYDGYGTFVIRKTQDFELAYSQPEEKLNYGFIAEPLIPFKRELSLIAARNTQGDVVFYPLFESFQKDSRCFWVKGPVRHKGLSTLQTKVKKFLNGVNYVGVIAFELFDHNQKLLINEIAPRVHNTGHLTLDAFDEDQFTLHLKCLVGAPIRGPKSRCGGYAMVNLLGKSSNTPNWTPPTNIRLHWYGKKDNRAGRKMGHLNCCDKTPKRALQRALKATKDFQL